MIHAYDEKDLNIIQEKLASIFEIAVVYKKIDIDDFAKMFYSSKVSKAFEKNDLIYTLGKSASELLAIVLNEEPKEYDALSSASPEYWVGYVLSYVQWYYNLSFEYIINKYPLSQLINNYFPYHEMDVNKIIELYDKKLNIVSKLKKLREEKKLSQSDLAILSNVPIRNIKAYEQGSVDISKAQAEALYKLSKALDCKIEDLL